MPDTARTRAALQALLADNTSGDISAQDVRDFLVSVMFPQLMNGFRLTLESGVSVSTTDQTAKTTVYLTPHVHNCIGLYDGTSWETMVSGEVSLALGTLTANKNYDVFAYNNAGTLTLQFVAWTNDTTRATAVTRQDGVLVKSGDTTKRYVGTFRTVTTTTTQLTFGGSTTQVGGKMFLWNAYNQVPQPLKVIDTADTWSYTTNTTRVANGATGPLNCVEYITGDVTTVIVGTVQAQAYLASNSTRGAVSGVGVDSTSAFSGTTGSAYYPGAGGATLGVGGKYVGRPGLGYHYLSWLEKGSDGTCLFTGDNTGDGTQCGLQALLMG